MTREFFKNTILTMGQLCCRMLRPQTISMIPHLFWSLVFWFADAKKGVVKVLDMFEAALTTMDWDCLYSKGRACKEQARERQKMAKARKRQRRHDGWKQKRVNWQVKRREAW